MEDLKKYLIDTEKKYGGFITGIKRNKVSVHDPRTKNQLLKGGMQGGDRMSSEHHNYSEVYSKYLKNFLDNKDIVIVEIGILKGTGLAIWSDLFPNGRVIGLDIDLSNFNNNKNNLLKMGAFKNNNVEVYEFDQFLDNKEYINKILGNDKVSIVIDDGMHIDQTILQSLKDFQPFLNKKFLYIIEDNNKVHTKIKKLYKNYEINNYDRLTIVKNLKDN